MSSEHNIVRRHGRLPVKEGDCSNVWNIPVSNRCQWVINTDSCTPDAVFDYTEILFCVCGSDNQVYFSIGIFILIVWLLYLFLVLGTTADNFFCPSLAVIADVLRLSDNIAGVTILAFGNGAPDIFTSVVSGAEGGGVMMFTELIGAGVFVTGIIAGSVALAKPFRVNLEPFMRDSCFYVLAIGWIAYITGDEVVHLWEATSLILIYVLFIVTVVLMQMSETRKISTQSRIPNLSDPEILHIYMANRDISAVPKIPTRLRAVGLTTKIDLAIAAELERNRKRGSSIEEEKELMPQNTISVHRPEGLFKEFLYDINPVNKEDWEEATVLVKIIIIIRIPVMLFLQLLIPVVNPTATKRGWSKLLNCFQLILTPLSSLFLLNYWRRSIGPVPLVLLFFVLGTVIALIVFLTTHVDRVPKFHNLYAFLGFFGAMLTVYLLAGEVIAVLQAIGYSCSISPPMLGITLLAWGNSVGDLISNMAIAKRGFPKMAFAACFGGPMFNTLIGMGLSYGIFTAISPNYKIDVHISPMAPGCMAILLCSLTSSIMYLTITGSIARPTYAYLLYSIYFVFILIQLLSEINVIHPLGTDYGRKPYSLTFIK